MKLVVRNNQPVLVWRVSYSEYVNGFDLVIFVEGTEEEIRDYLDSEIGYVGKYKALNESEVSAVSTAGLKVYIAPQLGG